MKKPRVKKSIRTLAQRQGVISRRRPSKEEIERLNRIFAEIDKGQEEAANVIAMPEDMDPL